MEGTITIINDPSKDNPKLRDVVDKVIRSIEDLKIDGYDIRVTFVQHNRVTVDVNPIGVSDELVDLLKLLDKCSTGILARTGMTKQYFDGYFTPLFREKLVRAYPTDNFDTIGSFDLEKINFILNNKQLKFELKCKARPFDTSGTKFYWLINTENKQED